MIIEQKFKVFEPTPTNCTYCEEEKTFLMVKPIAVALNGELQVNVNMTGTTKWMCLECFSMELDAIGHTVDIYEYK